MNDLMKKALEGMKANGFEVVEADTAAQAKEYLLGAISRESTVGTGGSMTVLETGILDALIQRGNTVYSHWKAAPEDRPQTMRNARNADVYLTSANAVTKDGRLVLVDGTGNRVGAVCDGPRQVYFVISHKKLVDGGTNTAVARIKKQACPPNASRLGLDTPCARTGICGADCPDSMCRLTLTVDRTPRGRQFTVIWVEEPLGY